MLLTGRVTGHNYRKPVRADPKMARFSHARLPIGVGTAAAQQQHQPEAQQQDQPEAQQQDQPEAQQQEQPEAQQQEAQLLEEGAALQAPHGARCRPYP
jgi:hypothetical protein